MIGIVDYNAGNIKSVERALAFLKADYVLSKNPADLEKCEKLIFPGVGDAAFAMKELKATGFDSFLKEKAAGGVPIFGICLGSQIIFDWSEEGDTECLGLLKGKVRHFNSLFQSNPELTNVTPNWCLRHPELVSGSRGLLSKSLKVPHMGWNNLSIENGGSKIFEGVSESSDFYFVHSYVIQPDDFSIVKASADYGIKVPACVQSGNIIATQFHPEKSGEAGLRLLRNFAEGKIC